MVELAVILASALVLVVLLMWSATSINYHVTPTHLKITWLGLPVRRIRLDDIKFISTRPSRWAEKWYNTLVPGNRLLAIHRRTGLWKTLLITPEKAFVFRYELQRAQKEMTAELPAVAGPADETRNAA